MNIIADKIKNYLNELLKYDWDEFNKLESIEQGEKLYRISCEFEEVLKELSENNTLDFNKINAIIDSYFEKFEEIKIEGKSKHIFRLSMFNGKGGRTVLEKLIHSLKNIEYDESKKYLNGTCDCELTLKFNKKPEISKLIG